MTDERKKHIGFRIGMCLHNIALAVDDKTYQNIKYWMDEIEQLAKELVEEEGAE
jgi:ABC-type transporter Mla maintaining outer membrane lipid asymmetry ATPase subunit MlaF